MIKKSKALLSLLAIGTMVLVFFPQPTYAFDAQVGIQSFMQSLAQKLGLQQSVVQKAVDEIRTERRTVMEKRYEDLLTQAVIDNKITEAQKKLLLDKHEAWQKTRAANQSAWQAMSPEDRRLALEKDRTELENWAKQNNIDTKYLFGYGRGMGMRNGFGMGMRKNKLW